MRPLYPDIAAYKTHQLAVDERHVLYVEESGNPEGIPVLFVHGGPGSGCSKAQRCFFNPERYRIILFDQRGSGRSTPHAELVDNSTPHLLEDMEKIRRHLQVEQWLLFGGSWGSTLSLLYAQRHPERVSGLILRGIFLARQQDIRWLYQAGANRIFPDYWQDFIQPIPARERDDIVSAYYQRLTSSNELERMGAAKSWATWEGRCSTLAPNPHLVDHFAEPHTALAIARIEAHYFNQQAFIEENQILQQADRLAQIPTTLIHGRYDMVCPVEQAFALHQALPTAQLHIVRGAGHSAFEPGIQDNLIKATDQFAERQA